MGRPKNSKNKQDVSVCGDEYDKGGSIPTRIPIGKPGELPKMSAVINGVEVTGEQYVVISNSQANNLSIEVVQFMRLGFKPQGGVCVTSQMGMNGTEYTYFQAMVKQ